MPPPKLRHGRVAGRIYTLLTQFASSRGLGETVFETGFLLTPDPATVRAPDVAFFRAERARESSPDDYVQGGPDLAVEVVSPSDSAHDLNRKVRQYLSSGAQAVWVVYPEEEEVHVFESGSVRIVRGNDVLAASAVLPGFQVTVQELFA